MLTQAMFRHFDGLNPVAHGLPAMAYTHDEFWQLENQTLFAENWVFAGFAHDLPLSGDVKPIQIADQPLFLLRDADGEIRAFHNLCRHRNLKLIDAKSNCGKLIRCPYHSWSYDLCGQLKNAPYFGGGAKQLPPDFDLLDYGLLPVNCAVWYDWIFVNLAEQPKPFEDFLAPIKRMLGDTVVEDYHPVATIEFDQINCNWKLLVENFIEPYHVQFVHRSTTNQPLENHTTLIEQHCLGSEVELDSAQQSQTDLSQLGVTSHYLTLFPGFILGTYQPDQLGVYLHQPLDANHTRQRRVIYAHAQAHYSDAQIEQIRKLWHKVHLEDHEMCIRMQQGRHSPMAEDGGVLSPHWERSVGRFHQLIAAAVRNGLPES